MLHNLPIYIDAQNILDNMIIDVHCIFNVGLIIQTSSLSPSMHCISTIKLVLKTVSLYQTIWTCNFLCISHCFLLLELYLYIICAYSTYTSRCPIVILASCLGASHITCVKMLCTLKTCFNLRSCDF